MADKKVGGAGGVTRRALLKGAGAAGAAAALAGSVEALAQETDGGGAGGAVAGPGPVRMTLSVNGKARKIVAPPRRTLLDVLRSDLDLTGAKKACDRGTCGACTIWLDGKPVYACMVLAIEAIGHEITTIEGLGTPDALHPVQAAFGKHDALQCGFCTPGFVMTTAWAVEKHGKRLDRQLVMAETSGNLCRCGTYSHVIAAALDAAGAAADAAPDEREGR